MSLNEPLPAVLPVVNIDTSHEVFPTVLRFVREAAAGVIARTFRPVARMMATFMDVSGVPLPPDSDRS